MKVPVGFTVCLFSISINFSPGGPAPEGTTSLRDRVTQSLRDSVTRGRSRVVTIARCVNERAKYVVVQASLKGMSFREKLKHMRKLKEMTRVAS